MAKWLDQGEFVNQNARIANTKLHSPQNTRIGANPPMMVTYYHINSEASSVNKGLQNVEQLAGATSGNVFNKIVNVPLWDIPQLEYNVGEDEEGLDVDIEGSFKLPPNVFHPFPDDYFVIDHADRPYVYRVTSVNYDTPTTNGFFRCEFEFWSSDHIGLKTIEDSVQGHYHCIMDHIGTSNKAVVSDDDFAVMHKIRTIRESLRKEYFDKYYDKQYNAIMYNRFSVTGYLYDPLVNYFCNTERVFEIDDFNTADCYLLYVEKRNFHAIEYESSIYDRIIHRDLTDLSDVCCYYDLESPVNDVSIFDFNKDHRVKYVMCYTNPIGPFGNTLGEYIPKNFLNALDLKSIDKLKDRYERFIFTYMVSGWKAAMSIIETVNKRRIPYDMHTYIFVPLVLYSLRQIYNEIICDTSIMDEELLFQYSIEKGGKQ